MKTRKVAFCLAALLIGTPLAAQDARAVLEAAATTLGVANLKSIRYTGTGWKGAVGQNYNPESDWPRSEVTSYSRTIDFETPASKEEWVRIQGDYSPRGGGGTPLREERREAFMVSGNYAWNTRGDAMTPAPTAAEVRRLEIWLTPHGFVKAALASDPIAVSRMEYGEKVTVVSFKALGKYRVNATFNDQNLILRVQTWLPNPVVGDMYWETMYHDYKDFGGVQFPTRFHQHQDHDDNERKPNVSGGDHSFGLFVDKVEPNARAALTVPDRVRGATVAPVRVESQKMADGVWYLGGASHNSVAIEFGDYSVVVEAPLNEARSLAVIAEVKKLIPNKPIRFLVNTHHHWDHLGGMRAYVHEGATVITHETNRVYYEEIVTEKQWILDPDRLSLYPPEEVAEGYTFESFRGKYVISNGDRTLDLYHVEGLDHCAGMLIAYLPKEKIVVQADLYSPRGGRAPASVNDSNRTFHENIKRLRLDIATIAPVHGQVVPMSQFLNFMEQSQ